MLVLVVLLSGAVSRSPLIVVSFDGYRREYVDWDREEGRGFDVMKKQGGWASQGMFPPIPPKTFPSHYLMATGLWPENNGIVGNHMHDSETNEDFGILKTPGSTGWFKGEPIWETAEKQGMLTAVSYWPGSEASFAHEPTYVLPYNHSATQASQLAYIEGKLGQDMPAELVMAYFKEPDSTGHGFGPNSTQVAAIVKSMDATIESLVGIATRYNANLLIVSDHGMSTTSEAMVVPLYELIDTSSVVISGHSPFMQLFTNNTEAIYTALAQHPHLDVYKKSDIPASWHIANSPRVGDVLIIAKEGWSIKTSSDQISVCCGQHGYNSTDISQRAIFFAQGPDFRSGGVIKEPFVGVNLYPLMCKLLDLKPAPNNGTVDVFKPVLKRSGDKAQWVGTVWQPARSSVTLYPATGKIFPGVLFDVGVTVPRGLPGAALTEVAVTANGADVASICKGKATTSSEEYLHYIWRNCSIKANTTLAAVSGMRSATSVLTVHKVKGHGAKNIILMIGDGMSLPMLTATRIVARRELATDKFDHAGTCFTKSIESIVTDSAASASALNTGHKTVNGATGVYPDSTPDFTDNPAVETTAEYVRRVFNMKIGVVTTASLLDATPAGVWGHCSSRSESEILAQQALEFQADVLLGGGLEVLGRHLPQFETLGYTVCNTSEELSVAKEDNKVLGVFAEKHLATSKDRQADPENTQPGLPEMATAALDVLHKKEGDSFYLMVEAASIDKMAHACDYTRMIGDTLEMQETIIKVQEWLEKRGLSEDTLIVVTSDHATGGYDVYGTVDTDEPMDNLREGIKMYGKAGWPDWEADNNLHVHNWDSAQWTFAGVNTNHPSYKEDFKAKDLNPGWLGRDDDLATLKGIKLQDNIGDSTHHEALKSSVHTASDVMVYANGKGSQLLRPGQENTEVFHVLISALHPAPQVTTNIDQNSIQLVFISIYIVLLHILALVVWYLYARASKGPSESYTVELSEIAQELEESTAN